MDDYRYRQQSPRNEQTMNNLISPPRNGGGGSRMIQSSQTHEQRTSLPRRFTTDSGRVPTLSSITNQRGLPPVSNEPSQEYHQTIHKVQLLEKKKLEYERIREQRRRFELEMQKLEQAQKREELELAKIQDDLRHGHQSEPTTPPEYRNDQGYSSFFGRPNRYSTSSLTSPPGLFNRPGRSGSQLQSPQSGIIQSSRGFFDEHLPSRSVPTTRRNSDEHEKDEAVRQDPSSHRSSNAYNRYSMPVTRSRNGIYASAAELDQTGTARFLFGEEDSGGDPRYGGRVNLDDNFPTLVRREDQMLSASSAALDLALSPSPAPDAQSHGWSSVNRHRTRQSLSTISTSQLNGINPTGDVGSIGSSRPSSIRHSLDLKFTPTDTMANNGSIVSPTGNGMGNGMLTSPPKLQSSFSANDVPTVKNTPGANNHAQQHFHNHNASIGRIPAGAVRHNRELSNDSNVGNRDQAANFHSIQSALHGNAAPFGPTGVPGQNMPQTSQPASVGPGNPALSAPVGMAPYGYYGGPVLPGAYQPQVTSAAGPPMVPAYGTHMLAMGMQNMTLAGPSGPAYGSQNFTGYGNLYQGNQPAPRDSQARVIQHRRQLDQEAMQRYNNLALESVGGQIYELCKDQHGCRYLQKKLEERNANHIHQIWLETNAHVIELMTDPFGNYLCQKLLEFCNDEERTKLIENAAQDMVRIALNQHGTRALQKMIEFVTTPAQVQMIINALRYRVVDLIQDLNGNHVIQKCLNKLSAPDAQFIFDAVGNHCIEVGTHRHGCCVLQRCIDHADGDQKVWLIGKITEHAPALVQDPFGNYVVQYIIDLNEPAFTEPVVAMFRGRICQLSRHKFSSNVIEKCLRCSMDPSRDMIVEELLAPGEVERILRDNYANYVIQTALEYASPQGKVRLVDCIRPHLAAIRSTPYGRRIQAKIQAIDSRGSAASSGQTTPADSTGGQMSLRNGRNHAMAQNTIISNDGSVPPNFTPNINGNGRNNNTGVYPHSSNIAVSIVDTQPQQHQRPANNYNGGWAPQAGGVGQSGDHAPSAQDDHAQWL